MQPESKIKNKIEILKERSLAAEDGGGKVRLDKQRELGKMTARERVEFFLDDDSFEEFDKFGNWSSTSSGFSWGGAGRSESCGDWVTTRLRVLRDPSSRCSRLLRV
jgi:acetyl-CoA carboxylase carboxyltransferase component